MATAATANAAEPRMDGDHAIVVDKERSGSVTSNGNGAGPIEDAAIERDRKISHSSGKDVHDTGSSSRKATELKPIGIINEQNTCFLNSTFQAVSPAP